MRDIQVGNNVKAARLDAGLTQQELADAIGVTRQTIGLIEAENYNPTIKLCLMIAQVTGVVIGNLFWIEGLHNEAYDYSARRTRTASFGPERRDYAWDHASRSWRYPPGPALYPRPARL
jgi:putative transcriptional regulator